jgi:hypothetical protein
MKNVDNKNNIENKYTTEQVVGFCLGKNASVQKVSVP